MGFSGICDYVFRVALIVVETDENLFVAIRRRVVRFSGGFFRRFSHSTIACTAIAH